MEVNSDGYLLSHKAAREISTTFLDTNVNNCFSIILYTTEVEKNGAKNYFSSGNKLKNDRFLEFRSMLGGEYTCIITSKLANQRAPKSTIHLCGEYSFVLST